MIVRHVVSICLVVCFIGSVIVQTAATTTAFAGSACDSETFNVTFDNTYLASKATPHKAYIKGFSDNTSCTSNNDQLNVISNLCNITVTSNSQTMTYSQTVVIAYGTDQRFKESYYIECRHERLKDEDSAQIDVQHRLSGILTTNATSNDVVLNLEHTDSSGTKQAQYKVGQYIKFSITPVHQNLGPDVKVALQRCYASSDNLGSNHYDLINGRCPTDPTTTVIRTSSIKVGFQTRGFRYLGAASSTIYMSCQAFLCEKTSTTEQCRDCGLKRRRRDVETDDESNVLHITTQFEVVGQDDHQPVIIPIHVNGKRVCGPRGQSNMKNSVLLVLIETLLFIAALALIRRDFDENSLRMKSKQEIIFKT